MHLSPGEHQVALIGAAHAGPDRNDRVSVARTEQAIHVGVGAAVVSFELSVHGQETGLEVAIRVDGAATEPPATAQPRDYAICRDYVALRHALCRAGARLDDARRRNDPAYLVCVRDKLAALR